MPIFIISQVILNCYCSDGENKQFLGTELEREEASTRLKWVTYHKFKCQTTFIEQFNRKLSARNTIYLVSIYKLIFNTCKWHKYNMTKRKIIRGEACAEKCRKIRYITTMSSYSIIKLVENTSNSILYTLLWKTTWYSICRR